MDHNIPSLIETLRFSDEKSREQAAGRLEKIGRRAVPSLLELLGDESDRVRWRAVWALEEIADPMAVPGLLTALGDRDERVRIGAISALKRIGGEHALNGVIRALGDPAWPVRRESARALGEMGGEVAIPYLLDTMQQDDDWSVRRVAAVSLGQLGDRRAADGLLAALHDQNVAVRVAAARSLGQIGDKSLIPDLKRLLSQQFDNDTRRALEHTLGKLDPGSVVKPQPLPKTKKTADRAYKSNIWSRHRRIRTILSVGMFILTFGIPLLGLLLNNINLKFQAMPHLRRAREYRDEGNLEAAARSYERAIENNPKLEPAYFELCQVYDDLGELDSVIRYCTRAVEFDPTNAEAYYLRGWAYRLSGKYSKSQQDFDRGRVIDPELSSSYIFWIPEAQGDRGAVHTGDDAAEADLELAHTYYDNCRTLTDQEDYPAAIKQCNKAIELNLAYAAAYNARGWAFYRLGVRQAAREDFDWAIEFDPEFALAYNNRGLTAMEVGLGGFVSAIDDLNHATELDPELVFPYNNRCQIYLDIEDFSAAIEQCNKAIELDPEYALAYNNRGLAYLSQNNLDAALSDLGRSSELDPGYIFVFYNLGQVYQARWEQSGQEDEQMWSTYYYDYFWEQWPDDPEELWVRDAKKQIAKLGGNPPD